MKGQTMIVADHRVDLANRDDVFVVTTPLEVIATLEQNRRNVSAVVLTGDLATDRELAAFLIDAYPALRVVSANAGEAPDPYLPAFA